ncbi:hypothetical protein DIPPA_15204 [Diplonema papillatum]|nr:hypothetical protein DIPPA_15204 [Diplonema papillatum]
MDLLSSAWLWAALVCFCEGGPTSSEVVRSQRSAESFVKTGVSAAHAELEKIADFHRRRECPGWQIPKSKHHRRFDKVGTAKEVLSSLTSEYCGLAEKMKENGMRPPLYVDVGSATADPLLKAVGDGCRVAAFAPSQREFDRVRGHLQAAAGPAAPEARAEGVWGEQVSTWPGGVSHVARRAAVWNATGVAAVLMKEAADDAVGRSFDALSTGRAGEEYTFGTARAGEKFAFTPVPAVALADALSDEPVVPVLAVDANGWEAHVLAGAEALFATHRIQAAVVRLWPAGLREANGGDLPKRFLMDFFFFLHRRGYYLFQTDPQSKHLQLLPSVPACAGPLVDFLDESASVDPHGLWVDIIIVK